jgi:hypothetical protein
MAFKNVTADSGDGEAVGFDRAHAWNWDMSGFYICACPPSPFRRMASPSIRCSAPYESDPGLVRCKNAVMRHAAL